NHTDCPLTDFRGKTSIFSHPVYLFLRKFSLQDSRGGSSMVPGSLKERIPRQNWSDNSLQNSSGDNSINHRVHLKH
ncbi:hypothetical protein C6515_25605, partial [Escherichia coli]|nr:hypothetical protein [Escherichia coli]